MHAIGTTDPEAQAAAEQAAGAKLDEILDEQSVGDPSPSLRALIGDADTGGSEDQTPEQEPPAEAKADDAEPQPEAEPGALSDDLLRALNRAHVPEAVRESMDAGELRRWAEQLHEQQANVDSYTARMKELEAKVAGLDGSTDGDQPEEGNQPATGDEEGNQPAESQADPLADFAAEFGDDAAEAVRKAVAESTRASEARAQALEQRLAEEARQRAELARVLEVQQTAQRVLAPWNPTDEQRVKVGERMDELAQAADGSTSLDSLTEQAARDVLGPPPSERGTPTPPSGAPMNTRPLTPEQKAEAALDMILDGKPVEEVKRAIR